jgi:hypothetical protein
VSHGADRHGDVDGVTSPVPPPSGAATRYPSVLERRAGSPERARTAAPLPRLLAAVSVVAFAWLVGTAVLVALVLRHARVLAETARTEAHGIETVRAEGPAPSASTTAAASAAPSPSAPPRTKAFRVGAIELVELGLDAANLTLALSEQARESHAHSRAMLVLVTDETDCVPCRHLEEALPDPRVQSALASVRVVRLSRSVFKEELASLGLQTDLYPMFLRFGDDLSLLDAIHGGEWDADVPANIAPVLGAFVEGTYRERRHPRWTPARRSQRL